MDELIAQERLFERASGGELAAFNEIFAMLYVELAPVVRKTRRSQKATGSLLHDVYLRTLERFEKTGFPFRNGHELKRWVYVLAHNIDVDCQRKRRSEVGPPDGEYGRPARQESSALLNELVRNYPVERALRHFWQKEIEGFTYKEIAATVGLSESTIKDDVKRVWVYLNELTQK